MLKSKEEVARNIGSTVCQKQSNYRFRVCDSLPYLSVDAPSFQNPLSWVKVLPSFLQENKGESRDDRVTID